MTTLYVCGPMSGLPEHNYPAFRQAAYELRQAGYLVIDPSDKGVVYGWQWADYMRASLTEMLRCDGVALLEGWRHSDGAVLEVNVADDLSMPVRMVGLWLDLAPNLSPPKVVCK